MTGLEFARECCRFNDDLNVLYVSGSSPGDDLRAELAAERRAFLAKPFRQSDLLRYVKAVLGMQTVAASSREMHAYSAERQSAGR